MKHLVVIPAGMSRLIPDKAYSACGLYLHKDEEVNHTSQVECKRCKKTYWYRDVKRIEEGKDV